MATSFYNIRAIHWFMQVLIVLYIALFVCANVKAQTFTALENAIDDPGASIGEVITNSYLDSAGGTITGTVATPAITPGGGRFLWSNNPESLTTNNRVLAKMHIDTSYTGSLPGTDPSYFGFGVSLYHWNHNTAHDTYYLRVVIHNVDTSQKDAVVGLSKGCYTVRNGVGNPNTTRAGKELAAEWLASQGAASISPWSTTLSYNSDIRDSFTLSYNELVNAKLQYYTNRDVDVYVMVGTTPLPATPAYIAATAGTAQQRGTGTSWYRNLSTSTTFNPSSVTDITRLRIGAVGAGTPGAQTLTDETGGMAGTPVFDADFNLTYTVNMPITSTGTNSYYALLLNERGGYYASTVKFPANNVILPATSVQTGDVDILDSKSEGAIASKIYLRCAGAASRSFKTMVGGGVWPPADFVFAPYTP